MRLSTSWRRVKLQKRVLQVIIQFHDGCLIAASIAVVGSREDGHDLTIMAPVVAFHDQLMSSCNQRQAVRVIERLRDVLAKGVASSARRDAPAAAVIWIRPQQVTHGPFMGHLLQSIQSANVVQRVNGRREAAVKAEDLPFHQSRQWQEVKQVREGLCVCVDSGQWTVDRGRITVGQTTSTTVHQKDA